MRAALRAGFVALALVAAACGGDEREVAPVSAVPASPGAPGDVISAEPIDAPDGARAWRVVYHSTGLDGADIAVTGMVVAPDREPPPGGFPVVSWGHPTQGTADRCAPSVDGTDSITLLEPLVEAGYVVAASDYEGLGTTSPHLYLVGDSEGRSVLDAARAAQRVAGSGASPTSPVALWGFSQGGHAALFGGELAPAYAPELDLRGVAAAAPVSDVGSFAARAEGWPEQFGVLVTIAYAFHHAYDDLRIGDVLTPAAVSDLPLLEQTCLDRVLAVYDRPTAEVLKQPPATAPGWPARFTESQVGNRPIPAPVLVIQGTDDVIVYPDTVAAMAQRLCANGTAVDVRLKPGEGHGVAVQGDLLPWLAERFAGAPAASTCP
ncbi:MAG: prolyl oligopeptidase family serine peptidase [Acidimicrobiales bacterium]|nr:prolyl oligopeptidase family serine peptidase [Acidimicrobiales bacterium]